MAIVTLNVSDTLSAYNANHNMAAVNINDTSDNIAQNLASLKSIIRKIVGISQTDVSVPLIITSSQLTANKTVLDKITTTYSLSVNETPASKLSSLISNTHIGSITVLDTVANLNKKASLSALTTLDSKVTSITQSGANITPIALTVSQYSSTLTHKFTNFTAKITDAPFTSVTTLLSDSKVSGLVIKDFSINIASNLDAIQLLGNKIIGISQTGTITPLNLTANQLINDADTLNKITNRYTLIVSDVSAASSSGLLTNKHLKSFSVTDDATNLSNPTYLSALIKAGTKLTSVTESGTLTPISISASQYNKAFTGKLSNVSVTITDAPTKVVNSLNANTKISSIQVSDTAKNIGNSLKLLQTIGTKISSISLTGTTDTLAITYTQYTTYQTTLSKISSSFTLTISAVSTNDAATVLLNTQVLSISISDTGNNVASALDNLKDSASSITRIVLTDSPATLTITTAQLNRDAAALALITSNGSTVINGVTHIDNSYELVVTQVAAADITNIFTNPLVKSISITDTTTNVVDNIATIKSNLSTINSISLSDSPTPLILTETQLSENSSVLAIISGTYTLKITDVLVTNIAHVLSTTGVVSITVSDDAATINNNLNALETYYAAGKITGITSTDSSPLLTISYTQLINDADVLSLLSSSSYTLTVSNVPAANITDTLAANGVVSITVSDNATNIKTNLDALQTDVTSGKITDISINNGPQNLTISYTQYTADTSTLALLETSSYTLTVTDVAVADISSVLGNTAVTGITVNDSAATIVTNLDSLQVDVTAGQIKDITLSDGTILTPALLAISYTQLVNDAGALALIDSSTYTLNVSNVPVNKIPTILAISNVTTITVSDTASTINANLNALQTEVAASHINGITLNDVTAPAKASLLISYTQLINDAGALALLDTSTYTLTVSNVLVANIANVTIMTDTFGATALTRITVSDSAANIKTNLDALQTDVTSGKITDISINNGPQNLTISYTQYTADTGTLALLETSSYTLTVTDVAVADISSVLGNTAVTVITVNDSALTIVANLNSLQTKVTTGQIKDITLSDGSTSTPASLAISYTQLINDAGALALIDSSTYTLNVSNVPVNKIPTILAISNVTTITVSDTASTINANLNALQTEVAASHINGITLNDVTAPAKASLLISYTQLINDAGTLALLNSNSYTLTVSNVPVANITDTLNTTGVTSITVTDSATTINTNLNTLQTAVTAGTITDISINNGPQNLTITYTQYTDDTGALALLETSSYTLTINDVAVANISTITSNSLIKSINILDSSSHITSNLNTLQANKTLISSISFTDAPTNLSITPAQLTADTNILDLISATNANILFNVDLGNSGVVSNLDTSNGHINLIFNSNTTGTPSDTNFETINHFSSKDVISFSSGLNIVNNSSGIASGVAFIDNTTGTATFDISDVSLQQQIVAVENAINMGFSSTAGNVAYWTNGNDSYAFITDNTVGVSSGDNLIKFIGIDISHLGINTGTIVYI